MGVEDEFMAVDQSSQIRAEPAACKMCGAKIRDDELLVDSDGRTFCETCYAQRPPPLYQCSVCRRRFPAEQVYDANGSITCTDCFAKLNPPGSGAAGGAPELNAPLPPPPPRQAARRPSTRIALLAKITCPHCWHRFLPQDILWVARHSDLLGDERLGRDAAMRFLPSRFNADGAAIDARGMVCQALACPECHLIVPRPLLEAEPFFSSIIGVSASGKSYFLTAMTWELRRLLPSRFAVAFSDTDALTNSALNHHEETLFLAADPEKPVKLDKTDVVGSLLYDQIHVGQQVISLPRPFLFTMLPSSQHPNAELAAQLARVVCVYDNAGEHFNPGEDVASSPVTQHLGRSRALMFLYDPTQDPRFRARCRGLSRDPQLEDGSPTRRQETVLLETVNRLRLYGGLASTQKLDRPMLVIVPKADVWSPLCGLDLTLEPIIPKAIADGTLDGVDVSRIEGVSTIVREMLLDTAPEFVLMAEDSCTHVIYIPISALGGSPEMRDGREGLWIRPSQIRPQWVTVPFLYMFARWSHDLIGGVQ